MNPTSRCLCSKSLAALPLLLAIALYLQGCATPTGCDQQDGSDVFGPRIASASKIRNVLPGTNNSRIVSAGRDNFGVLHVLSVDGESNEKGKYAFAVARAKSTSELDRVLADTVEGWLDDDLPWGAAWCELGFFYTQDGRRIGTDGSTSSWIANLETGTTSEGDEIVAATFSPKGELAILRGVGIAEASEGTTLALEIFRAGASKPHKVVRIEHVRYGAITVTTQRTRGRLVFNKSNLFAFLPGGSIWMGPVDGTFREVVSCKDFAAEIAGGNLLLHGWTNAVAVGDGAFGVGRYGAWSVGSTTRSFVPVKSAANSELLAASCTLQQSKTVCFVEDLGSRSGIRLFLVDVDSLSYSSTPVDIRGNPSSLRYLSIPAIFSDQNKRKVAELVGEDGTVYVVHWH